MRKSPILALALAAAALSTLAGCTAPNTTASTKPTTSAKPTATTEVATGTDAPNAKCVDGSATIVATAKQQSFSLPEGCDNVSIVGSGAMVELGDVKNLVIEGDKATVTAKTVSKVGIGGSDNSISYTGTAPVTNDQGKNNTIEAAK